MVNVRFDGNKEAERVAEFLEESERVLAKTLVIFECDGRDEESTYVRLKREMGERLGVIVNVDHRSQISDLRLGIEEANRDETVDGVMVQLPILDHGLQISRGDTRDRPDHRRDEILSLIKASKDVDGLNPKSHFVPAVVRATERVMDIFFENSRTQKLKNSKCGIALVGSKGMVGKRLGERLKYLGFDFQGFDKGDDLYKLKNFEVVITATGVKDLITAEMVKSGFVGIDLGFPKAEFTQEAVEKAMLITPVPGGVGPLTIVSLFENLAET